MKKMLATVSAVVLSLAMVALPAVGASADRPENPGNPGGGGATTDQLCTDITGGLGYEAKVDTQGDPATVSVSAPAGFLIDAYCVKAGTEPVIVTVSPAAKTVTIDHPTKDSVSHYQLHLVAIPTVTPEWSKLDQTCAANALVNGSISVVQKTGISYFLDGNLINGASVGNLAPGTYALTAGDNNPNDNLAGQSLNVQVTIAAFVGPCGPVTVPVTPEYTSTPQTCVADALVGGSVSVVLKDGITYTLTGPNPSTTVIQLVNGKAEGLTPGTYHLSAVDSNPNDLFAGQSLETDIVIAATTEPCGPQSKPVVASVSALGEQCVVPDGAASGTVVAGSAQLIFTQNADGIDTVEYQKVGAAGWTPVVNNTIPNLGDGQYIIQITVKPGYTIADSTLEFTIASADNEPDCKQVSLCHWTGNNSGSGKWEYITVSVNAMKAGHYEPNSPNSDHRFDIIPPQGHATGGYLAGKNWDANSSNPDPAYNAQYPFSGVHGKDIFGNGCATPPVKITPDATFVDEYCTDGVPPTLVKGVITVNLAVTGAVYSIVDKDGNPVPFNAQTGATGPLKAGLEYTVTATAKDGYVLAGPYVEKFTPTDQSVFCKELTTLFPVDAEASAAPLTCDENGSYSFSATAPEQGAVSPTVFWTVNGQPVTEGTYQVSSAGTVVIKAAPNGPAYGFTDTQQREWTFQFTKPTACGDLPTLALTGDDPVPAIAIAGFLGLVGTALVRSAARNRRLTEV